ncbi:MAG: hypothetical protein DBP03_18395 [gamma proteobacterium symbiont of Ctena orbiculata]|nr:MAG: hypothetical protein DBP03_18395 [gamma proteobacterium symbiont of Ctena orbiculata]
MSNSAKDEGVIAALLERFEKQRLPRAIALKDKVDAGEKLSQVDIDYLKLVFQDANKVQLLVSKYPEYEQLVAQAFHLYHQITEKALQNEQT